MIIAIYLAVFGVLFLFAPGVAARFTKTTHDPSLGLLYGQYALTFAFVSFLAAREKQAASIRSKYPKTTACPVTEREDITAALAYAAWRSEKIEVQLCNS
ncbi:MAG: hypothetical protein ACLQCB_18125 [Spirochaetia bacterium]